MGDERKGGKMKALDKQEGGDHYKSMAIQPVEYIYANNLGYFEGCVIKYVSRWRNKNGIEDLNKAKHFIDLLIELDQNDMCDASQAPCNDDDNDIYPSLPEMSHQEQRCRWCDD